MWRMYVSHPRAYPYRWKRGGVGFSSFVLRCVKEGEVGMRRIVLLLATTVTAVLLANGVALALPSDMPDNTPMVDGRVRAIEQAGTNLWVGGKFTRVQSRDGTVVANVSNVAVFDLVTEEY